MVPSLIGLYSDVPQSGKSTVAKFLCNRRGFRRMSFAAPLKGMVEELMKRAGISEERIAHYREAGKEEAIPGIGRSYRSLCQTLGTDWGRRIVDPDLWVRIGVAGAIAHRGPVVFEDVRFENELDTILSAGGEVWRVIRPGAQFSGTHDSEGRLKNVKFDRTVLNNGTIEQLEEALSLAIPDHYPTPSDHIRI